jgi:DNA-binding NarL/FixJ family response regulator
VETATRVKARACGVDTTLMTPRLLIADDDDVVQLALYAQLHRDFEIVGRARDAAEAIELAQAQQPDIAIVDVQMPAGGGLRATREIRVCAPGTAIVALSADESDADVRAMLKAGAMAYLRKDATGPELGEVLRTAIAAHALLLSVYGASDPLTETY